MKIKLSEKAKKEIEEIQKKIRGDMTDKEWKFFKSIRCVCEFYRYQVLEMEHLDIQGKRDWLERLVISKVEKERERILKLIDKFYYSFNKTDGKFELEVGKLKDAVLLGKQEK